MRVYVGATFSRYAEVRAINDALRAAGHEITHDWTRTGEFDDAGMPRGSGYDGPVEERVAAAEADKRGVRTADRVLLLGQESSLGWPTEFGLALAYGAEAWVVAPFRPSIFWALPDVRVFDEVTEPLALMGVYG